MKGLLVRSSIRYLLRHPWLLGLSVVGVALGVAVVVSIDVANTSSRAAFRLSSEAVTGRATHQLVGRTGMLADSVYVTLRRQLGMTASAPVVTGLARITNCDGAAFQFLGVDPFAETGFRPFFDNADTDVGLFVGSSRSVLISSDTADRCRLAPGDELILSVDGRKHIALLGGLMTPDNARSRRALADIAVVDISTAQQIFDSEGYLSRIDLLLDSDDAGDKLVTALGNTALIQKADSRTETLANMTRAFEVNLVALSLLALVVGMFLIYNSITFSVVQRRNLIGRLRAMGLTRREVLATVILEALVIGVAGTIIGLIAGVLLGSGLVRLVARTINDLYFVVNVSEVSISGATLLKGSLLGIGATLVAALGPALEATAVTPVVALIRSDDETRARRALPMMLASAALLALIAVVILAFGGRSLGASYLAVFAVILSASLLVPPTVLLLVRVARPIAGLIAGTLGKMAATGIASSLSRTGPATAALVIAVAASVGVGVMVSSFRETVQVWLEYSLRADIYVRPPGLVFRRGDAQIEPTAVAALERVEGVGAVYTVYQRKAITDHGEIDLVVVEQSPHLTSVIRFKSHDDSTWAKFSAGSALIASEPLSYRLGFTVGDSVRLQTDLGPRSFAVAGVFHDYGSDQGALMMDRAVHDAIYGGTGISGLAIYVSPPHDVNDTITRLYAETAGGQELVIRSNRELRETSLAIFDRTFTITSVLRALAMIVAFVGVLSALMALQLERRRELAVLRANGMTPGQVRALVVVQTSIIGVIAGILAVPVGLLLAALLVHVINRRSFGWTLQFDVPPEILWSAIGLSIIAAVVAGIYPGIKMAQTDPTLAMRE